MDADIMKKADELYESNRFKEAYDLLYPHREATDAVVQWRFALICYRMGKVKGERDPKRFAKDAMEHIDRAVSLDPDSFNAQMWRGIILSWYIEFEGYKAQIAKSYEIRDNFESAIRLNPNDTLARHLMGRWYYDVSDIPWYMKSAAKLILGELPKATFEDALRHFTEAEKIEEGFFSQNWLYIGKCHYNLKNKHEARVWVEKVAAIDPGDDQDDREAVDEAKALLKKM